MLGCEEQPRLAVRACGQVWRHSAGQADLLTVLLVAVLLSVLYQVI